MKSAGETTLRMCPGNRGEGRHASTRTQAPRRRVAYTLVEVLIVVMLLSIVAMAVIPEFVGASEDAREAAVLTDLATCRRQIQLYALHHGGRAPHVDEFGSKDTDSFVARLTQRTDPDGKLNSSGVCGPYMLEWPVNPYCDSDATGRQITFAKSALPPLDGTSGWYYSTKTGLLHSNCGVNPDGSAP